MYQFSAVKVQREFMLTARKENNQSNSTPFPQRPPTMGSFDKVVDSIDGLRDRVQEFTLEQVSEADQKLRTMSLGLSELRRRLGALSEMKDQITRLQETIPQAEAESLEQSRLAMLAIETEPTPVHAIAQFGDLLKLRQVIKLVKRAQNVSVTLAPRDQEVQGPMIFEPFEIVPETPKFSMTGKLRPMDPQLMEAPRNEATPVASTESLDKSEEVYDPIPLEKEVEELRFFSNDAAGATQPDGDAGSIPIQDLHLESLDETEYPQLNRTFPVEEISATSNQAHTEVSEEADFDRRLLDDLIKNYGEFSIIPSSSSGAKVRQEPKNEKSISTPRTDPPIAVAPANQPTFPLQRKDGELDQKLKKLIKDYGEYDLYSRQTPLKLKTGVIAAFLVLSLLFAAFYFFSSPKSAITPSVSSASQSQNDSATPSKETASVVETSNRDPVSASSVSNGEASKPVDPGASHNPPNKVATKKPK
jgi:hypothetical protein